MPLRTTGMPSGMYGQMTPFRQRAVRNALLEEEEPITATSTPVQPVTPYAPARVAQTTSPLPAQTYGQPQMPAAASQMAVASALGQGMSGGRAALLGSPTTPPAYTNPYLGVLDTPMGGAAARGPTTMGTAGGGAVPRLPGQSPQPGGGGLPNPAQGSAVPRVPGQTTLPPGEGLEWAKEQIRNAYLQYLGREPAEHEYASHLGGGSFANVWDRAKVQAAIDFIRTSPEAKAYAARQGQQGGETPPPTPTPDPSQGTNLVYGQDTAGAGVTTPTPPGWDPTNWTDPKMQTPKYVVGRILAQFPPTIDGLKAAFEKIKAAFPNAKFDGKDKIDLGDGNGWIDVLVAAEPGMKPTQWAWQPDSQAGGGAGGGGWPTGTASPKYNTLNILAGYPPTPEGIRAAWPAILKLFPNAKFDGKDKIDLGDGYGWIDVIGNAGAPDASWVWYPVGAGGGTTSVPTGTGTSPFVPSEGVKTGNSYADAILAYLIQQLLGGAF